MGHWFLFQNIAPTLHSISSRNVDPKTLLIIGIMSAEMVQARYESRSSFMAFFNYSAVVKVKIMLNPLSDLDLVFFHIFS